MSTTSLESRRLAYGILAMLLVPLLAYFAPRTAHEITVERAKTCSSCLDSHQATIGQIEYDSGWNGSSYWTVADYTFKRKNGTSIRYHDGLSLPKLNESLKVGQTVTLRLYESELVYINNSYVHQAWDAFEAMAFLPLPPVFVAFLLLWYNRPSRNREAYQGGYIGLSVIVTIFSSVLCANGLQLAWWPLPTLAVSIAIPTLVLTLRQHKHRSK